MCWAGLTLVYELRKATRAVASSVQTTSSISESLIRKSLLVACLLGASWCGQAIAGFLAIDGVALDTQSGLESADFAFYVLDLLCLLLLLYFFYAAVSKAVMKRGEVQSTSSYDKRETSRSNQHHQRENSASLTPSASSIELYNNQDSGNSSAMIMTQKREPRLVTPASHNTR